MRRPTRSLLLSESVIPCTLHGSSRRHRPAPSAGHDALESARSAPDCCAKRRSEGGGSNIRRLRPRRLYLNPDAAPLSLAEPQDAQRAARHMAEQDRRPNVGWMQLPRRLDQRAQAEWDDDLGHDRDVERRPGVAGALESPRVRECDRDEQPRYTEEAEELHPEPNDHRVGHAE